MSLASRATTGSAFYGAKLALFVGTRLVTILRDDRPDIPWPGHWDLPGGGREGNESAVDCVLRETREEVGLVVPPDALRWARSFRAGDRVAWFFAAHLPAGAEAQIVLGDEGQDWKLMMVQEYLDHPRAIPHFRERIATYLAGA